MQPWQWQHRRFLALLLGIFILSGLLAVRYDRTWDLTQSRRNQLSPASIELLEQLQSPLTITAFTRGNPKVKALINRVLSRYQRHAELRWQFQNPDVAIDAVREWGIDRDGQLLLRYQNRRVLVSELNETAISRGIYTLLQGKTRHALLLSGRGEIRLDNAPDGYSQLKQRLQDANIELSALDLRISQGIPDHIDLLVVADRGTPAQQTPNPTTTIPAIVEQPQHTMDEQAALIADFLQSGGRLLWLGSAPQPGLSKRLGVRFDDGELIGQGGKVYGLKNPAYVPIIPNRMADRQTAVASPSQPSSVMSGIDTLLAFPTATAIRRLPTDESQAWLDQPLLVPDGDWLLKQGRQIVKAQPPIVIGMALTAVTPTKSPQLGQQRGQAIIIADADFANNRFIGFGQNGDFIINVFRYLCAPDTSVIHIADDVPTPVVLSAETLARLALVFIVVVPLVVLLIGWWVRRRLRQ